MSHKQQKILFYGLLLGVIFALVACIAQCFTHRPLGLDEAMLALSVLNRGATNLISEPLEWGQSAPIGYLYAVKLCTFLFGLGENALRLFSLIAWLGVCVLLWKIAKKILKCTNIESLVVLLIFMTNGFFVRYAHECKPYMNDNFWILFVLFSFWLYWRKSIKPWQFSGICSIAFLFSFSAAFAIASCYFIILSREVVYLYKTRKISENLLKEMISPVPLMVIGFLIAVYWVLPATNNAGGKGYWELWKFPLFPTTAYEWDAWKVMIKRIASPIGIIPFLLFVSLSLFGIYTSIRNKMPHLFFILAIILTIVFALIASNFGYYPIEGRLIQFIPVLLLVTATTGYKELTGRFCCNKSSTVRCFSYPLIGIIMCMATYNPYLTLRQMAGKISYAVKSVMWNADEKPLVAYETLIRNDKNVNGIYTGSCAMPAYLWLQAYYHNHMRTKISRSWELNLKKGWRLQTMEHSLHQPYSFGDPSPKKIQEALDWIKQQQRVYIFLSHEKPDIVPYLEGRGQLETLYMQYGIEIYRFTWNDKDTQTN